MIHIRKKSKTAKTTWNKRHIQKKQHFKKKVTKYLLQIN